MDEKANPHDLLETMETSEDEVQDAPNTRYPKTEGMGIRQHKKELLENFQQPNPLQIPRQQHH